MFDVPKDKSEKGIKVSFLNRGIVLRYKVMIGDETVKHGVISLPNALQDVNDLQHGARKALLCERRKKRLQAIANRGKRCTPCTMLAIFVVLSIVAVIVYFSQGLFRDPSPSEMIPPGSLHHDCDDTEIKYHHNFQRLQ